MLSLVGISTLSVAVALAIVPAAADVKEPAHARVVSANPDNFTPDVEGGKVNSMVQIGNRIIAVGKFTQVTPVGGPTVSRNGIFAFDATTGGLDTTFKPNVGTAEVTEVVDAGDGTVFIGGAFASVNGAVGTSRVARINATTGAVVTSFKAAKPNGVVTDMQLSKDRLYIGGSFTTLAGRPNELLAALDPDTGANTGHLNLDFADTFNGGGLGVKHFDISDDGTTLVAVGNWRNVNGLSRTQIAMVDTSGATAALSNWSTDRYAAPCASVFDTYMRDVDIAPSGDYFVAVTTGAFVNGTLCDSAARWEISTTGGQQPTWTDFSGGDTLTQVKVTGPAVYIGGHNRWMNNPFAGDSAGPGAVPRSGLAALDPRNGLPFSWDPGRARGVGVWEFLPTDTGLWIGHDTNRLGGEVRKRIAFMPLSTGTTLPNDNTGTLPGVVYSLGQKASATSGHWVARVNAGGPTVLANDNGPDWVSDNGPFRQGGNAADWSNQTFTRNATVPASTPQAIFSTERWGGSSWNFPAPNGAKLEVRLYFANGYGGTGSPGQRVFDVNIEEGPIELDDFDIISAAGGDRVGTMRSFNIASDGNVDIDLTNVVENPLINGIEIINQDVPVPTAGGNDTVVKRSFTGTAAGSSSPVASNQAWSSSRGAVMIDNKLFTGWSDGTFKVRTFNGSTFGDATNVNLYGLTAFANDVSNTTGMFFDPATGRLYYTLAGQSQLYYRYFTPESQVVGAARFTASGNAGGVDWSQTSGLFLAGGKLYVASSSDGSLRRIDWNSGAGTVSGGISAPVSGPTTDGNDYRARGTFLYAG